MPAMREDVDLGRWRIHSLSPEARRARLNPITAGARPFFEVTRRALPNIPSALLFALVGFAVYVGLSLVFLRWLPGFLAADVPPAQEAQELGSVRTAILASLAGLLALFGAIYTARTFALTRHGQITERFTRAIDQLGDKDSVAVRLGGVYALERLMRDAPEDRGPIIEILTSFVREHAPWDASAADREDPPPARWWYHWFKRPESGWPPRTPAVDVQAVLTVLGRRTTNSAGGEDGINLSSVDIRGADLRRAHLQDAAFKMTHLEDANLSDALLVRADFTGAHLEGVNLFNADLRGASLHEARLEHAHAQGADLSGEPVISARHLRRQTSLIGANLSHAYFLDANLAGASLQEAQLNGTVLIGANLEGAHLQGANLEEAHLQGANLESAELKDADLTRAEFDSVTRWRPGFDPEAQGAIRIEKPR